MTESTRGPGTYTTMPLITARRLRLLVLIACLLFVSGIFAPMMTISQLVVIRSSFSVFSGIVELYRNGQIVLFLVVTGFSIVVPILKLWVLFRLTTTRPQTVHSMNRMLSLMHEYGRWAMLDVMVVAILIVAVKLGTIASLQIHYGLYLFGAAVMLIMLITGQVIRITDANNNR